MTRPNPCAKPFKATAPRAPDEAPAPAVDPTAFEALKAEVAQLRERDRSQPAHFAIALHLNPHTGHRHRQQEKPT